MQLGLPGPGEAHRPGVDRDQGHLLTAGTSAAATSFWQLVLWMLCESTSSAKRLRGRSRVTHGTIAGWSSVRERVGRWTLAILRTPRTGPLRRQVFRMCELTTCATRLPRTS